MTRERFTRLYEINQNLYTPKSPVIIKAGVLLKDNVSKNILIQAKIQNIQDKEIKAVKVLIGQYDIQGNVIEERKEFQYLDLKVKRNAFFGDKTPIILDNKNTRRFSIKPIGVIFDDDSFYSIGENEWQSIKDPQQLKQTFAVPDFIDAYEAQYGEDSIYFPFEDRDLWICKCGNINHLNEKFCYLCSKSKEELIDAFDKEIWETKCKNHIYLDALELEKSENYDTAKKQFEKISGFKDSQVHLEECEKQLEIQEKQLLAEQKKSEEQAAQKREKCIKRTKKISAMVFVGIMIFLLTTKFVMPEMKYNRAVEMKKDGKYEEALDTFKMLKGFKDSKEQMNKCTRAIAERLLKNKEYREAFKRFTTIGDDEKARECQRKVSEEIMCTGVGYIVILKKDGTVVATGDKKIGCRDVESWKDIVQVSSGGHHTVGLKKDGTVVATGDYYDGRCDINDWIGIEQISAGTYHTVGLKKDGTVVATGDNYDGQCNVNKWKDIVQVSAGRYHTVGLKKDGTVIITGKQDQKQCDVETWKDIFQIGAGAYHTVGLKKDGTVVAAGDDVSGHIKGWTDINRIDMGDFHVVGLKEDGTVVAAGTNQDGQCDVNKWKDIVQISAGRYHTVGLKKDGTVVVAGDHDDERGYSHDVMDIFQYIFR